MLEKSKYGSVNEWYYGRNITTDDEIKEAVSKILASGCGCETADDIVTKYIEEYWDIMRERNKLRIAKIVVSGPLAKDKDDENEKENLQM